MNEWTEDIIPVDRAGTLDGLFRERVRRTPDAVAYRHYERHDKCWHDTRWRDMDAALSRWRAALAAENLQAGERVAVLLRNCREWVLFDQAALSLGLVVVPLYVDDRPDNVAYVLTDSQTRVLLIQSTSHWRRMFEALDKLEHLQTVILAEGEVYDPGGPAEGPGVCLLSDWLEREPLAYRPRKAGPHQLASIVYTSGTTGRPKGVMLSHHNMLSVAHAALTMIDCYQQDVFLSFLPLSHTLERTGGYYLPMMAGATVAFSRSVPQLAEDLLTVRPTVLIAVPRIFERVYGRIQAQMDRQTAIARLLFRSAVSVGWHRFERRQGRRGWMAHLVFWPLLRRLVADKITAKLGGRLRIAVSGGAALPLAVARQFIGLGLPILQGYGLTETSPVASVNRLDDNDPASVGVPLRGTEVRIGENDELLIRGPGVMLGYWNNHVATRQMIDPDGWLHSGDQARVENGHIYITGRIKDILVLSNGEKAPPVDMEAAICLDPLFEQALVVGEGRPYLSALIVLNSEDWFGFARGLGLDPFDPRSLADERLHNRVLSRLRVQLHEFPGYSKIRRVTLTLEPWTIEDGLLTPTLKFKRASILERFAAQVEAMYREG